MKLNNYDFNMLECIIKQLEFINNLKEIKESIELQKALNCDFLAKELKIIIRKIKRVD